MAEGSLEALARESLASYVLDEKRLVSYKWLCQDQSLSATAAKKVMASFVKENAEQCFAWYCVSGKLESKVGTSIEVQIVSQDQLEAAKKSFSAVMSIHIYCVHARGPLKDISSTLWTQDMDQQVAFYKEADLLAANPLRDGRYSAFGTKEDVVRTATPKIILPPTPEKPRKQTPVAGKAAPKSLFGASTGSEKKKDVSAAPKPPLVAPAPATKKPAFSFGPSKPKTTLSVSAESSSSSSSTSISSSSSCSSSSASSSLSSSTDNPATVPTETSHATANKEITRKPTTTLASFFPAASSSRTSSSSSSSPIPSLVSSSSSSAGKTTAKSSGLTSMFAKMIDTEKNKTEEQKEQDRIKRERRLKEEQDAALEAKKKTASAASVEKPKALLSIKNLKSRKPKVTPSFDDAEEFEDLPKNDSSRSGKKKKIVEEDEDELEEDEEEEEPPQPAILGGEEDEEEQDTLLAPQVDENEEEVASTKSPKKSKKDKKSKKKKKEKKTKKKEKASPKKKKTKPKQSEDEGDFSMEEEEQEESGMPEYHEGDYEELTKNSFQQFFDSAPATKQKKRKQIEKTYQDQDGYFVTELVWVTDEEPEEVPSVEPRPKLPTPAEVRAQILANRKRKKIKLAEDLAEGQEEAEENGAEAKTEEAKSEQPAIATVGEENNAPSSDSLPPCEATEIEKSTPTTTEKASEGKEKTKKPKKGEDKTDKHEKAITAEKSKSSEKDGSNTKQKAAQTEQSKSSEKVTEEEQNAAKPKAPARKALPPQKTTMLSFFKKA